MLLNNVQDSFYMTGFNTAFGTVLAQMVAPYTGAKGASRKMFVVDTSQKINGLTGVPNWWDQSDCFIHVTDMNIISATTTNKFYFMRPLNWTYFTAAVAANATTGTISEDPGIFSTNYRYPLPSGFTTGTAVMADDALAASDYIAYQLADGTWVLDTVSSISGTTLTFGTTIPNITGGGILKNAPLFFMGIFSDKDPATGLAHPLLVPTVSVTQDIHMTGGGSLVGTLHRGDPLMVYNPNSVATTSLAYLAGVYTKDW